MAQYQEGQRLQGSDGNIYVVRNGTPVRENSPLADPRLGYQTQVAAGQAAAAPLEAPKTAAELERIRLQNQAQPLQNANTQTNIAQGQAAMQNQRFNQLQGLRQEFNALPEVKTYSDAISSLGGALKAPDTPQGDLSIVYSYAKAMDPGSVVREGEMDMANSTASQTQQLQQYINAIQSGKRLPPAVRLGLVETMRQRVAAMRETYDQQRSRYAAAAKANGFDPAQVIGKPLYDAVRPLEEQYIKAHGETPHDPNAPDVKENLATGAFRSEYDPAYSAKLNALIRAGAPYGQAAALAKKGGFTPPDATEYAKAVAFAKDNPGFRKSLAEATRSVPTTAFEQFAASPMGAAISGAAKAGTLGTMDELAASVMPGDYATNRDAFAGNQSILAAQHPYADLAGQAAGGFATGVGINSLTSKIPGAAGGLLGAKTPFPSLLNRGAVAGDALFGAGYGAGSSNEDRLGGAETGLLAGVGGGIGARGTVNGIASAISPTGGAMRPLYDMGVRPSIGQRLGGVPNTIEEKLQSVPFVGDAIKGTRDRARDQFQLGLFNDALGQIGQRLPEGVKPGHAPHAIAQDAISNAYDSALSNMTANADPQLGTDIGALQRKVAGLRAESQTQFSKLWDGSVGRRFKMGGGSISGDAYKQAESELGKKVAALRSNPTGDHELAGALEDALGALRASALRNSPPEAVSALNAADAAHARIVRLEDASRRAGEPAEFSPTQYNTAVKNMSGGVRNRNYLRGDALNTDLAAIGTRLGDKVSNSGSIDRLLATMAVGGAGYVNPTAAAGLGALGALNAPGARNVVTELMAPRVNPVFDRAADQLRQRARIAGMFGAPLALDYSGQ